MVLKGGEGNVTSRQENDSDVSINFYNKLILYRSEPGDAAVTMATSDLIY